MPGLVIPKLFLLARSESAYLSVWVLLADLEKEWKETPGSFMISGLTFSCSDYRDLYLWSRVGGVSYQFSVCK